ncbi:MAG: fused MFS/spermidine synthase, partial [Candidatus Hydrogenedentes bacterium]|nr:fused MFS/spermidine synthase [Candidatus Hydrogenedentota bacterium]
MSSKSPIVRLYQSRVRGRGGALALMLAVLLFFLVSGACGLLYQVVWTRNLVLLFGTTSYAVSTVLFIFFLGLGLGSLLGGRIADRSPRPLLWYGLFEIAIGAWALVFILLIGWGESLVVDLLRATSSSRGAGIALRALLAAVFLIVPVTLMGTTLPLLARAIIREGQSRGLKLGLLYGINTLGAVTGCALTGFVFIQHLGYTRTTLIGVAANLAVGALALLMSWRRTADAAPAGKETVATPATDATPASAADRIAAAAAVLAFALSGFCALALEVLWTRMLSIVFTGTTYAYTTMLTSLLCGIALGSLVASFIADRRRHSVTWFGAIQILAGLACLYMLTMFASMPERFTELRMSSNFDFDRMVRISFILCFTALFIPTFLFGMAFPFAVRSATRIPTRLGRDVGRLYGVNTFAGVAGAVAGGYFILPLLGAHRGIVALGLVLVATGVMLVLACPTRGKSGKGLVLLCGAALLLGTWRTLPEDAGYALNKRFLPEEHKVIHYKEGIEGTVVVSEPKDNTTESNRVLWINSVQATQSIEKGVKMNRFQGVLPLLFDRTPRNALFMCFGSGVTAGTLGLSDFERIDAVEISRDVLGAAPLFAADNLGVLDNPKMNFVVDDGRNFLLTTENRYDLITFEPMPLAVAGVSTFYTQEFYEQCLAHLAPGGLVSQWVPLHSLDIDVVRSLVFTFR